MEPAWTCTQASLQPALACCPLLTPSPVRQGQHLLKPTGKRKRKATRIWQWRSPSRQPPLSRSRQLHRQQYSQGQQTGERVQLQACLVMQSLRSLLSPHQAPSLLVQSLMRLRRRGWMWQLAMNSCSLQGSRLLQQAPSLRKMRTQHSMQSQLTYRTVQQQQ